jgi:hypothetical protein
MKTIYDKPTASITLDDEKFKAKDKFKDKDIYSYHFQKS